MVRNVLGSLLALIGAAAAVWSPFRSWYDGRHGSDIRIDGLFTGTGVTTRNASLFASLFLPMAFAALLTLLGVLLRSRLVVVLAAVLVLGFTVLWMVRQAQFSNGLTVGGDGLGSGVAWALGGGLLILVSAFVMPGRRPPPRYGEPPQTRPPDDSRTSLDVPGTDASPDAPGGPEPPGRAGEQGRAGERGRHRKGRQARREAAPVPLAASSAYTQRSLEQA